MFHFSTKAQTLDALRPLLHCSIVPTGYFFNALRWAKEHEAVLREIEGCFPEGLLILRSSAANEDAYSDSMAGVYESVPSVPANDAAAVATAVERVIGAYTRRNGELAPKDQVLVQPMIGNISMAGVVFTQDLRDGAPYYVINYDDISGGHDAVTSGSDLTRTLLIHRGYERRLRSSRFSRLLEAVQEIEDVVGTPGLDIEFVVTKDEEVYVVQVRPMVVRRNWNRSIVRKVDLALDQTRDFVRGHLRPMPDIAGKRSLYSLMSDWNPVEMLGAAPRPLALSLYRHLITDSIWAEARASMGYRNLAGRPLLVELSGRPYIDVRESFNSFLPASLSAPVAERLVNAWLDRLEEHPELHDKVEFEVALTTHVPGFARLYGAILESWGLSSEERNEYENSLKALTLRVLAGQGHLLSDELDKTIPLLHMTSEQPSDSDMHGLYRAKQLLALCREHGTRPFSVLARCAFMSEAILRALVAAEVLPPEQARAFRSSISTVLTEFLTAIRRVWNGELSEQDFFRDFGHLRPGSYDILSPRYDQRQNFWGTPQSGDAGQTTNSVFTLSNDERHMLEIFLRSEGYPCSPEDLFSFMRQAIVGREEAKFRFTRALSQALEEIASWGEDLGLSREELSYLRIEDFWPLLSSSPLAPWEDLLRGRSRANMESHAVCQAIRLPYIVSTPEDVDIVPLYKSRPNFVTAGAARGRALCLTGRENVLGLDLKGTIVFIESADPGFDWIFAHPIAGLVTKYGGANSHMAIRCAELWLPAAIGCGEQLYESLKHSQDVRLDCGAEALSGPRGAQW